VINAITDALGDNDLSMPATPEKVWRKAQRAAMREAAE
jgi:carbon-monoxide dehydrogenase large subunit